MIQQIQQQLSIILTVMDLSSSSSWIPMSMRTYLSSSSSWIPMASFLRIPRIPSTPRSRIVLRYNPSPSYDHGRFARPPDIRGPVSAAAAGGGPHAATAGGPIYHPPFFFAGLSGSSILMDPAICPPYAAFAAFAQSLIKSVALRERAVLVTSTARSRSATL